jgi:hypothetical protein
MSEPRPACGVTTAKQSRSYAFIESTANMIAGKYLVRIWRHEPQLCDEYNNEDVWDAVRQYSPTMEKSALADLIAHMPRITAVEVQDRSSRQGIVLYVEWP